MNSVCGRRWRTAIAAVVLTNLHPITAVAQGPGLEFRQLHLGMEVRIVIASTDTVAAGRAAQAAFSRIATLEDVFSDWRPQSEVRRLTLHPLRWTPVSAELFEVLGHALRLARLSGGAFDPTVGPLTDLWRETRRTGALPAQRRITDARGRLGWQRVRLDTTSQAVRIELPDMRIDLGGIAKGWILEDASRVLASAGLRSHLIEAGGDLYLRDAPPDSPGWKVLIEVRGRDSTVVARNTAIATSGSSAQFMTVAGRRYSHIIDPRTGLGLPHARQVTVLARRGADADGVATALVILGRWKGRHLARQFGIDRVFITD